VARYIVDMTLIVEADSLEEVHEVLYKIVNADFGEDVDRKIERFGFEHISKYEE